MPIPSPDFPWWVEAAYEPVTVLAAIVAGLTLWKFPVLLAGATTLGARVAPFATRWGALWTSAEAGLSPPLARAVGVTALLLSLAGSWALYRWTQRLCLWPPGTSGPRGRIAVH